MSLQTETRGPGAPGETPSVAEFWDRVYAEPQNNGGLSPRDRTAAHRALTFFGDVRDRHVLDIGTGRGETAVFFAAHGARVTAVDVSEAAVRQTRARTDSAGVGHRVTTVRADITALSLDSPPDAVFGIMILHHIEPFAAFAQHLHGMLAPGGRGFFLENNSRSGPLMWCRNHLSGRFGIRKDSDPYEYPLTPEEVRCLARHFETVVEYPEMVFFRLLTTQALRGALRGPLWAMDRIAYTVPSFRSHSYHQNLMLTKLA